MFKRLCVMLLLAVSISVSAQAQDSITLTMLQDGSGTYYGRIEAMLTSVSVNSVSFTSPAPASQSIDFTGMGGGYFLTQQINDSLGNLTSANSFVEGLWTMQITDASLNTTTYNMTFPSNFFSSGDFPASNVTLTFPLQGEGVDDTTPTLAWTGPASASSLDVETFSSENFNDFQVASLPTTDTSHTFAAALPEGDNYAQVIYSNPVTNSIVISLLSGTDQWGLVGDSPNTFAANYDFNSFVIPEPASVLLLITGTTIIATRRRR